MSINEIWSFIVLPLLTGLLGAGGYYLLTRTKRAICDHQWFNMVVVADGTNIDTGRRARICEKCYKMEHWDVSSSTLNPSAI